MSAAEDIVNAGDIAKPKAPPLDRVVDFLSSVRFGVVVLCSLVILSMIGMLIMQQNVQGFEAYYASLTPAEKLVFGSLGIFDIYHSWYFNFILIVLSLNIVLASIDHFPAAWSYISRPKLDASKKWLLGQKQSASVHLEAGGTEQAAERIGQVFKGAGLKTRITEKKGNTFVFGESGRINRLGAYIVHVCLLTLFIGHFVALQTGVDANLSLFPGEKTDQIQELHFNLDRKEEFNVKIPFMVECTDISQKLIDMKGSIDITNTMDWATRVRIDDPEYGITEATISLNNPFSYRGYRFFQAQAASLGNARSIDLQLIPEKGGEMVPVQIMRNGSAELPDGTKIGFDSFHPDFTFDQQGQPTTRSVDYNNPAAILSVTTPAGEKTRVFAFANKLPDDAPINAPKAGYRWRLTEFEKSPFSHTLSIKYDPYNGAFIAWYFGGFGLIGALMFVFFISHRRVWALVEKDANGGFDVTLGGNTNRNQFGFEDKFQKIVAGLEEEKGLDRN